MTACQLVDEIANSEGMVLGGAEDDGFVILVRLGEVKFHAVTLAFLDFDDAVEIGFDIAAAYLDFAFDQRVIRGEDVLIEGGCELLHLERGEVAIVDAVFEGIDVDGVAEVGVGVGIAVALGSGGEAQLDGGCEVSEDVAPGALVIRSAAMAFIDEEE